MSKKKQEIIPVRLQSGQKSHKPNQSQKLVARLKSRSSELFVYEEIQDTTLRILLEELSLYETH